MRALVLIASLPIALAARQAIAQPVSPPPTTTAPQPPPVAQQVPQQVAQQVPQQIAQQPGPQAPPAPPAQAQQPGYPGNYPYPQQPYPGNYPYPQQPYYAPQGGYGYNYGYPVWPATMPYEEGRPIPPGYHVATRASRPFIISGISVFGGAYLGSLLTATFALTIDSRTGSTFGPLYIPFAGPFVAISTLKAEGAGAMWLIVDGGVQLLGGALFLTGLINEEQYLERGPKRASKVPDVLIGPRSAGLKWTF
jgi:hypothetical protein